MQTNKMQVNFSGGEVSPDVISRIDLPLASKVAARIQNFIVTPQGPIQFRSGTRYVHHTRNHNPAFFIEFQFSDIQSYLIEATEGYFRFYKDGLVILADDPVSITGITQANPGVVTAVGHGLSDGQEVYILDVEGMTEVNKRFFNVDVINANTFRLLDSFNANIDTTGYTAYTSGGLLFTVYEIKAPYREQDLADLKYDQNADTMYIVHKNYEPRKLTRAGHAAWTLSRYARTADPFAGENTTFGTITAITQANPGVITDAGHTFDIGDKVYVSGIVGMTELNDRHYVIGGVAANLYSLEDVETGEPVNTTGYTAYTSGGIVEKIEANTYPGAVCFTDGTRLGMGGSDAKPETMWYSRAPSAAGALRFDDYTTGTLATDALIFVLAPLRGKVDSIRWMTNTDKYIAIGTFGSIRRVFGATEGEPIATDAITARTANSDGTHTAFPVSDGPVLFYISRSGLLLETLEYDVNVDGYIPTNRSLGAFHLSEGGLKQLARQAGYPLVIWALRNDGILLGYTYNFNERSSGWHRHEIGGNGIAETIGIMPRANAQDQLWLIVKRTINSNTVRYVEYITDYPVYPHVDDYNTGNKEADYVKFLNYQSEIVKNAIHVDSALTYDGAAYGTDANANITVGAGGDVEDTENVTITATESVFTSNMVNREIWGAYDSDGNGGGRLKITEFVSSASVKGVVLDPFPALQTFVAGNWFLTATTLSGLSHLEGSVVKAITDGAVPADLTVVNGSITWTQPASVVHVGLPYTGILKTIPLDQGGVGGSGFDKIKNVIKAAIRFLNSSGVQFGTSLYNLERIEIRRGSDYTDRPVPLFTGVEELTFEDNYARNKEVYVIQTDPLPCVLTGLDIFLETADE